MKIKKKNKKPISVQEPAAQEDGVQDFLDMIAPSVMDFSHQDYLICGNTHRCVWAVKSYPTSTEDLTLLRELGEKDGITLHIYTRPVSAVEQTNILNRAERKNNNTRLNAHDLQDKVSSDANIKDVEKLAQKIHETKEPLVHCAVFVEMITPDHESLNRLQLDVKAHFSRCKILYDNLWLQQKEGFMSVIPTGSNQFGKQFDRVLPASSVANLFPFSYSGKTDPDGLYIGRDANGSNIIVNFDRRSQDKTNGHIVILGNSGEGKSFLLKLIITNIRQMGKKIYILDPEDEFKDLILSVGGTYVDMMGGQYFINVLEPRIWAETTTDEEDMDSPAAFQQQTRLSQHIAYLRDFFKCYKKFSSEQLDTLEVILDMLYKKFLIDDKTDFSKLKPQDYPTLSDLFKLLTYELENYKDDGATLYSRDVLRTVTLGLRAICVGSESKFFNGFTNIPNADCVDFSVKGMLDTNGDLMDAMFMNIFSYMSHKFLTEGDTEIALDEFHMFLQNKIAIDYTRSFMKRGRKKNSGVILASTNVEDFALPGIAAYTKPLLSIPTHSFIFNPGTNCDAEQFRKLLSLSESEFNLIRSPRRGYCLYRCGNERYHLHVVAPKYKQALFGTVGGK